MRRAVVLVGRPVVAALLLVMAVLLVEFMGCSAPTSLDPDTPPGPGGTCGTPLTVFNPLSGGLVRVGTDTTLDMATWNLEFFPLDLPGDYDCPHPVDVTREQAAATIINALGLDIIAIEEISDTTGFQAMVALCPGYGGVPSPEVPSSRLSCNYQRPGFIYRKDQVRVRKVLLPFASGRTFTREPLQADLTVTSNGRSYDLSIIVVHLKAGGTADDLQTRREESAALHSYLDAQAAADSTVNYMVMGDWNDQIEDAIDFSSFPDFISNPDDYQFLDTPLVSLPGYASYISSSGTVIDHLLINRAACPDFAGGRVTTPRLDSVVGSYNNLSDHRPVMVQAPVFR
jgi:hypothetical protein